MYPLLRRQLSEGLPEFHSPVSVKDEPGELISFSHAREFSSSLSQATTVLSEGLSNNIVYRYVNDKPGYSENASFNEASSPSIYLDIAEDTRIVSERALQSDVVSVKHEPSTRRDGASFGSVCDPTFSYGEETLIVSDESQQSHHIVPVSELSTLEETVFFNQPCSSIGEETMTFAECSRESHNIVSVQDKLSTNHLNLPSVCITQHTTKLSEGLRKTQNSVFIKKEPWSPAENGGDGATGPYPVTLYQVTPKFRESADRSLRLSTVSTPDSIEIENHSPGKDVQENSQSQRYPFCEFAGIDVDKLTKLESCRRVIGSDKLLNGAVLELFTLRLPLTWLRDCLVVWLGGRIPFYGLCGLKSQQRSYIMSQMEFLWINYNQKKDLDNQQEFVQFLNTPFAMSHNSVSLNMPTHPISGSDPLEQMQEDSVKRKVNQDSGHLGRKFSKGSSEYSEQHPFCKLAGIDVGSLLKYHNSCPHVIDQEKLLNGAIIEMSELKIQLDWLIRCLSTWLRGRYSFLELGRISISERLYILSQFDILGKKHEEKKRLSSPKVLQDFLNEPFRLHAPNNTSRRPQATGIGKSRWNDNEFPETKGKNQGKKAQVPCKGHGTGLATLRKSNLIAPKTHQVIQKIQKMQELKEFFASKLSLQSIQEILSCNMQTRKTSANFLEEYRSVTLPYIISSWKTMAGNTILYQIHNRCTGLNLLAACNDQVSVTLKMYEDFFYQIHNVIQLGLTESQTVSLIQTIGQAFAPGGKTLTGLPEALSAFLHERGLQCQWTSSQEDHMNSLFDNAGALYYHHRHLIKFLEEFQGKRSFLLSEALLKNDLLISGCRALGLLGKFFTGPLYTYTHLQSNCSLVQMSTHYETLIANLKICTMKDFLNGSFSICSCLARPQQDVVLEALVSSSGTDAVTELILAQLLEDISNLFKRLLQGQLPKQFVDDRNGISSVGLTFDLNTSEGQVVEPSLAFPDPEYHILKNFAKVVHWFFGMDREDRRHTLSERSTLRKMSLEQFKEKHRAVIA